MEGGDGTDFVRVHADAGSSPSRGPASMSSVVVRGGAGNDSILLVAKGSDDAFETLLADGGPGFDVCVATANVTVVNCEVTRVTDGLFGRGDVLDDLLRPLELDPLADR